MKMNQSRYRCDWDAVFAPPIPDELLFDTCNEIGAFKLWFGQNDVWAHIRAARSWEEPDVRWILRTIVEKLDDDVLQFLGPRAPIPDEQEAQAELDSLFELIFWVLQDVAEFMRIGDAI